MSERKPIYRMKIEKKKDLSIGTFDIETEGLYGDFIIGMTYNDGKICHFDTATEMFEYMLKFNKYTWYAHNGSRYDFVYIAKDLLQLIKEKYELQTINQAEKPIAFIITKGRKKVVIADSIPAIPSSLKAAAAAFCPELPKLDIGLADGVIFDKTDPVHIGYAERDVEALALVIERYREVIHSKFGVNPKYTGGSTAVQAWTRTIPEGEVYYMSSDEFRAFMRNAYSGGVVFVGSDMQKHYGARYVDFNAAYAWAMKQGVPKGNPVWTIEYEKDVPGFWHVIATVPEGLPIGVLQYKTKTGGVWATGTFESYACTEEIEFAKTLGYSIEVLEGCIYPDGLFHPFDEFIDMCQEMEIQGGAYKPTAKIMRNSLYGKFGMKDTSQVLKFTQDDVDETWIHCLDDKGQVIDGMYLHEEPNNSPFLMIQWAAYITMWQRLRMFKVMYTVGIEHVLYGDTDSLVFDSQETFQRAVDLGLIEVGKMYGQVKVEHKCEWFQQIGPKSYHLIDQETGEWMGKMKGIPYTYRTREIFEAATEGVYTQVEGIRSGRSLMYVLKNNPSEFSVQMRRSPSNIQNSSGWRVIASGNIRPVHIEKKEEISWKSLSTCL